MTNTMTLFVLKNKTLLTLLTAMILAMTVVAPTFAVDESLGLVELTGDGTSVENPENALQLGQTSLQETIASLINTFIGLLGIVAVIIILIGGFQWMTAAGDTEKIDGAKQMIYAGVAGLAVILAAYAIATFVIEQLTTATGYGEDVPAE